MSGSRPAGVAEALAWLHTGAQVDVVLCELVTVPGPSRAPSSPERV